MSFVILRCTTVVINLWAELVLSPKLTVGQHEPRGMGKNEGMRIDVCVLQKVPALPKSSSSAVE